MKPTFFISMLSVVLLFNGGQIAAQTFTRGHYTDLDEQQYTGHIAYKIGQNYFHYRENSGQKAVKLKPEEVQNFVWGIDSFVVREEMFVRVLISEGPVRLYRDDRTGRLAGRNPVVGEKRPGFSYIERTFLVERPETEELLVLENKKKKKFVQQIGLFFADAPDLVQQVKKGAFGPEDVRRLVKLYNEQYAEQENMPKN